VSCAGAGSVDVTRRTSRHLSTPKRLAESPVSGPDPRGAAADRIARDAPLRSRRDGAASGPRFCGFSKARATMSPWPRQAWSN